MKLYLIKRIDHTLTQEFTKHRGQPNASRNMRAIVKQYNPLHYIFGTKLRRTSHESE